MTLGDRIVIMKDGFIQQVGTPTEVFDMPDNLFVAEFIGAPKMNTLFAELVREGDNYYVNPYGYRIDLDEEKCAILREKGIQSQKIILGVRPEHIERASEGGIPCTIQVNEMMGSELHIHATVECGDKLIIRIPTVNLTADERKAMTRGNILNLDFQSKVIHMFDPETERNLLK